MEFPTGPCTFIDINNHAADCQSASCESPERQCSFPRDREVIGHVHSTLTAAGDRQ